MIDGGEGGGNSIGLGPQPPTHTRPQIVSLLDIAPQDVPAVVSAVTSIVSLQWPQKATLLHILPLVHDPDAMCLIMLLSSKVIGFAKLIRVQRSHRNLVGFLACLIIDKDHRHQGFGAYFLDDVERRAAESMYSRIYLSAELSPIFFSVSGYTPCPLVRDILHSRIVTSSMQHYLAQASSKVELGEKQSWATKALIEERPIVNSNYDWWWSRLPFHLNASTSYLMFVHYLPWSSQIGPSCGLSALRMSCLASCARFHGSVVDGKYNAMKVQETTDFIAKCAPFQSIKSGIETFDIFEDPPNINRRISLLQTAIKLKFTWIGEMFNALHLACLAKSYCGLNVQVHKGTFTKRDILNHIINRKNIILAYDRGPNHQPILNGGNSAHWAIITGILINMDTNHIDVILQHGLSHYPLVVKADLLLESNKQLTGPISSASCYRIGSEGIQLAQYFLVMDAVA